MEIEFDEQGLKEMAVVKWRLGPEEWSAKVVPLTRADADVDQNCTIVPVNGT